MQVLRCSRRACTAPISRVDLVPYVPVYIEVDPDESEVLSITPEWDRTMSGDRHTVDVWCSNGHQFRGRKRDPVVAAAIEALAERLS